MISDNENNALKLNLGVNNLVFKRFGAYTSVEYDLENQNWLNTVGGTFTLFKYVYLWGGMDLFTSRGLFQTDFNSSRKELGIGLTPYKGLVLRAGYNSIGLSFSAGYRIAF